MSSPSEKTPSNDEAIEAIAAAWLVQREEGLTTEQETAFARWQAADPRHAAAVALLEETCGILEKMPLVPVSAGLRESPARPAKTPARTGRLFRFPTLALITAAAAAGVVVALAPWRQPAAEVTFAHTYTTAGGGYLRVVLPDTSVLELNGQSEARVQFSDARRQVVLAQGEGHFTVAKNPARPFIVDAGKVAVRAVGTAFNVRREAATIEVLVTEGRVQVSQEAIAGLPSSPAVSLADSPVYIAGQRVVVSIAAGAAGGRQVTTLNSAGVRSVLAWQAPRLVFVDTPLAEVARQFNQQNRVQLEIGDAELGQRPVGGTFRADNVEAFVRLLETAGDVAVERPSAERIVLRKAPAAIPLP